ncbi:hypothetical protein [Plantactinospora sp. WMMB782]|uniref:hypothetical protein n=1 Tax=Plantactinospora sp. WMMB782 TaxID=3404121 RepID=UPI003B96519B
MVEPRPLAQPTQPAHVEWRYLPKSQVKHALTRADDCAAMCGLYVLPASMWLGTGSQVEYETVAGLRECRSCVKALGR